MSRVKLPPVAKYFVASHILGRNFITPEQYSSMRRDSVAYSSSQMKDFERHLPQRDVLELLSTDGFVLLPGPPTPMTMRNFDVSMDEEVWEQIERESVVTRHVAICKWIALAPEPIRDCYSKSWAQQWKLLMAGDYVPTIAELLWGTRVIRDVLGISSFAGRIMRSGSQIDQEHHLVVTCPRDGFRPQLSLFADDVSDPSLSIACARPV